MGELINTPWFQENWGHALKIKEGSDTKSVFANTAGGDRQATSITGKLLGFGGDEGLNIWSRLASLLPLIALVAGLAMIQNVMDDDRANELAEIDSALLVDDLPPAAYADPGFLQFLKNPIAAESKE